MKTSENNQYGLLNETLIWNRAFQKKIGLFNAILKILWRQTDVKSTLFKQFWQILAYYGHLDHFNMVLSPPQKKYT